MIVLFFFRFLVWLKLFNIIESAMCGVVIPVVFLMQLTRIVMLPDQRMMHLLKQGIEAIAFFWRRSMAMSLRIVVMMDTFIGVIILVTIVCLTIRCFLPVFYPAAVFIPSARYFRVLVFSMRKSWVIVSMIIFDFSTILVILSMRFRRPFLSKSLI